MLLRRWHINAHGRDFVELSFGMPVRIIPVRHRADATRAARCVLKGGEPSQEGERG